MIYPLKFIPIYKQYIWGGRNLLSLGKKLPEGIVAESWELCCHPDGMSIISNGTYAGRTLQSLLEDYGHAVMGNTYKEGCIVFPLMVKSIYANDKLSVQVILMMYMRWKMKANPGKTRCGMFYMQSPERA